MMPWIDVAADEPPLILTEHDAGKIADLFARCADYFMLQDGEPATLADALDLFHDVPRNKAPDDQIIMGLRGGSGLMALAAILRNYPSDDCWYLGFIIVDPAVRAQGIGRLLHRRIEKWAAACGAQEMRLAVLEQNEPAKRFWRALGYRELRRVGPDIFKSRSHCRVELYRSVTDTTATPPTR